MDKILDRYDLHKIDPCVYKQCKTDLRNKKWEYVNRLPTQKSPEVDRFYQRFKTHTTVFVNQSIKEKEHCQTVYRTGLIRFWGSNKRETVDPALRRNNTDILDQILVSWAQQRSRKMQSRRLKISAVEPINHQRQKPREPERLKHLLWISRKNTVKMVPYTKQPTDSSWSWENANGRHRVFFCFHICFLNFTH